MAASQRIFLGHIKGEKGDPGEAATVGVGTVGVSAPGSNPQVTEGGTAQNRLLNFVLPRGEVGPGGGLQGVRSVAMPLIHRIPVDWPFAPHLVLGAMNTLGWGISHFQGYQQTRFMYFTNHPANMVNGWNRTSYSPDMSQAFPDLWNGPTATLPMWNLRECPVNFATSGYRGNWCRAHTFMDVKDSINIPMAEDFDGLVLTNSDRALWLYGRGTDHPARTLHWEAITLQGIANAAISSMWAGTTSEDNRIWVIQANRLFLAHIRNSTPGDNHTVGSGVHRRITGPNDIMFADVTDSPPGTRNPALPTTMSRVHAEGNYAVVWGTNPNNRLSYFDGTTWYALTVPFIHSGTSNVMLVFPDGRIGAYNYLLGDYYTCDNPTAATPEFILRFRTGAGCLLTNGFMRGIPQFLPRGYTSSGQVYCWFDARSDDGGKCYVAPRGPNQNFAWPNELYCSTTAQHIVPSTNATQGYAYTYGTRESTASTSGDGALMATSRWYSPISDPAPIGMPPNFEPAIPNGYTLGAARRLGPFFLEGPVSPGSGSKLAIYVANPATVAS